MPAQDHRYLARVERVVRDKTHEHGLPRVDLRCALARELLAQHFGCPSGKAALHDLPRRLESSDELGCGPRLVGVILPPTVGCVPERRRLRARFFEHVTQPEHPRAREVPDERPDRPVAAYLQTELIVSQLRHAVDQPAVGLAPALIEGTDRAHCKPLWATSGSNRGPSPCKGRRDMRCTISRFASEPSLCRERCGDGLVAVLECFKWMRLGWHSLGGEDQQDPPRTWGSHRGWSSAGRDPRLDPATPLRH